jgi:nitrous oxidase accessory protein NosD
MRAAIVRQGPGCSYRGWMLRPTSLFAVLGLLVLTACTSGSGAGPQAHGSSSSTADGSSTSSGNGGPPTLGPATPVPGTAACDGGDVVDVADADGLRQALDGARPGQVIRLGDGRYEGNFVATAQAAVENPIRLCGTRNAVLDGGDVSHGYTLYLKEASYWHVLGLTVTGGQKGVMVDSGVGNRIEGLLVTSMGDEAIHLRSHSTGNVVIGNTVRDTGRRKPKFGEGIYIGSAKSNWCRISTCEPDRSDSNVVEGNDIAGTTAESVDIKEGTSDGVLRGNVFNGSGMVQADSWVDVKGNSWSIEGNTGRSSPQDGFQVHQIVDGWGLATVFSGNTAVLDAAGYAFNVAGPSAVRDSTKVGCDNVTQGARSGMSNVACRG